MAFFKWNEKYSVGILSIDRQHARLVSILNEMFEAMKSGKGKEVVGKVLNELTEYTRIHFKYEEQLFDKYKYVNTLNHKSEHQVLLKQVEDLKNQFNEGKLTVSNKVFELLKNWLINHIEKSDKQYSEFLRKHGVK